MFGVHMKVLFALQELYTGSNDCQIVVWAAPQQAAQGVDMDGRAEEDSWSD